MTGTEIVKILLTGKIKEPNLSIREDKFCTFSCVHDGFFPLMKALSSAVIIHRKIIGSGCDPAVFHTCAE